MREGAVELLAVVKEHELYDEDTMNAFIDYSNKSDKSYVMIGSTVEGIEWYASAAIEADEMVAVGLIATNLLRSFIDSVKVKERE